MKYRIWDKEKQQYFKQGEWETFIWVDHEGKPFELNITVHGQWLNPNDISDQYEVEYSFEKKDINGIDIFCGDILEVPGDHFDPMVSKHLVTYDSIIWTTNNFKIVGNKNENKELWESL